jgi:hypothetical protein
MFLLAAAALLVSPARSQERASPAGKSPADESVKKVKELRKERIAVLKEYVAVLIELRKKPVPDEFGGGVQYEDVLEAKRLLCEAELEAAETDTERVELYTRLVGVLKDLEMQAEHKMAMARGLITGVLKAKARRLEAEIYLEQAKMKVAKAGK